MPSTLLRRFRVGMNCPEPEKLLEIALARGDGREDFAIALHARDCSECSEMIREIRAVAGVLKMPRELNPSPVCMDADAIGRISEGRGTGPEIAHAAECDYCRTRLASVNALLDQPTIRSELDAVEVPRQLTHRRWSRTQVASGVLTAAAAAAIVMIGTLKWNTKPSERATREVATTATAAPRILSSSINIRPSDSLRWSRVSQADLYEVRIWNTEGTVIWSVETRDSVVAIPGVLTPNTPYMWDVRARSGWDRWVSSEFVELTVRAAADSR